MKKLVSVIACAAIILASVFALNGCSNAQELKYDVVLITDGGTVNDGAYNESAWKGISEYSESAGLSCRYYQPLLDEGVPAADAIAQYIDLAAKGGASYIVLPSDVFEVAAFENAQRYQNINFILIDGKPHAEGDDTDAYLSNVMCVTFDELQSGFLAGYNAVISGNTELGYLGSFNSTASFNYGSGFIQGAQYAADEAGIPVTLKYADYDSPFLNYDYSFTIMANYAKIEDLNEKTYKINVVNGIGSGTYTEGSNVTLIADPAPEGQVFDHWEAKSDTEGVKDKKVNLSTKKKTTTNLLVEKCAATITAVYKDSDEATYPVTVMNTDGTSYSVQYATAGASCYVNPPVAQHGMVFDRWDIVNSDEENVYYDSDLHSWAVKIDSENPQPVTLTPVYAESETPTFDVTVVTGEGGNGESTGSGSYITGDFVSLSAAVPQDGYIFTHWSNADTYGYGTGISMENEFYPNTSFEMVNRYQSVVETMYNEGATMVFAGGHDEIDVVSEATWSYSFPVLAIGAENWQTGWDHYYSTTVKEYGEAVKACLADFKGGFTYTGDCLNGGISMNYVDEANLDAYSSVFESLGNGTIPVQRIVPKSDIRQVWMSECLTLDSWMTVPV